MGKEGAKSSYTKAEVDALLAAHAALASVHHTKYTDAEAIAAAGTKVAYKTWTRVANAGDGSVSYTGVGFKPKAIFGFFMVQLTTQFAGGLCSGVGKENGYYYDPDCLLWVEGGGYFISIFDSGGNGFNAHLVSFDDDGFTLSYEKSGNNTRTVDCYALLIG
jgi:hypothetical protein